MNRESQQWDGRKTYEPPQLTTISLRPEEAVLYFCKSAHSGTHDITECRAFGLCKTQGS